MNETRISSTNYIGTFVTFSVLVYAAYQVGKLSTLWMKQGIQSHRSKKDAKK